MSCRLKFGDEDDDEDWHEVGPRGLMHLPAGPPAGDQVPVLILLLFFFFVPVLSPFADTAPFSSSWTRPTCLEGKSAGLFSFLGAMGSRVGAIVVVVVASPRGEWEECCAPGQNQHSVLGSVLDGCWAPASSHILVIVVVFCTAVDGNGQPREHRLEAGAALQSHVGFL